jgi:peptidoglycan/xylan/chitin deacetylase (PgdA/CDA1 family)
MEKEVEMRSSLRILPLFLTLTWLLSVSVSHLAAQAGAQEEPSWKWPDARWRGVVEEVRAGRRLLPASWPDGAKVAVALSFDFDSETPSLRDNETSPSLLSQGQYGSRTALPRILKLLERYQIVASFFVPAVTAKLYPDDIKTIAAKGYEIGIHGWIHERNSLLEEDDERDLMKRAFDTLTEISGKRPVGIRTPSWDYSPNTLKLIQELGLLYDSSLMADDSPYEVMSEGRPSGVVELPVEWILDDYPYFGMSRFSGIRPHISPNDVFEIWAAEFDLAYEEGGLFLLTMHPHITGHRSRIQMLEKLVRYIRSHPGVWFATHEQVARYAKEHSATGR